MAHRIIRLGSRTAAAVDLNDVSRVSWPDKDLRTDGNQARIEGSGGLLRLVYENIGKLRAVALAYDTDWDLVRVLPKGAEEPLVLGPGQVLDLSRYGVNSMDVLEHVSAPSTRLYDATTLQRFGGQAPTTPPGLTVVTATQRFRNDSGAPVNVYRWDYSNGSFGKPGGGWTFIETIAPGGLLTQPLANDNTVTIPDFRAADWGIDQQWNLADFMEAGLILGDDGSSQRNVAYISQRKFDSRGQPGSNGNATTTKYVASSNLFAPLSSLFFGRLSLEVWTDSDCPPHGYVPRLAPVRYVSLDAIALAGAAAAPNTPILTVPAINVERAQYVAHNGGAGNVFAQLVQPRAQDWIDDINGVADVDPASGSTFATIANGKDGAAFLDEPASPFIKLVVGADGAGATIAKGSVLSLVRRAA